MRMQLKLLRDPFLDVSCRYWRDCMYGTDTCHGCVVWMYVAVSRPLDKLRYALKYDEYMMVDT